MYVDKNFFIESKFRKISLKHLVEISSARIEEIVNIVFNLNQNLNNLKNKEIDLYLDFDDKDILCKFNKVFKNNFKKYNLNFNNFDEEDSFSSIKIFGELLSKGWTKEAIPVVNKKKSFISSIFSSLFD